MKIFQYFTKILSSESDVSSKRFAGLLSLFIAIVIATIITIKNNGNPPEYVLDSLFIYSASALGLTAIENVFKK